MILWIAPERGSIASMAISRSPTSFEKHKGKWEDPLPWSMWECSAVVKDGNHYKRRKKNG
jgi:hypothetical protein